MKRLPNIPSTDIYIRIFDKNNHSIGNRVQRTWKEIRTDKKSDIYSSGLVDAWPPNSKTSRLYCFGSFWYVWLSDPFVSESKVLAYAIGDTHRPRKVPRDDFHNFNSTFHSHLEWFLKQNLISNFIRKSWNFQNATYRGV